VGGESAPALRRTSRYAHGWYPVGTNPQHPMNAVSTFRQGLERFHGFCKRGGRARSIATRQIMTMVAFKWRRLAEEAAERGKRQAPSHL
jgi:hypothetical protein